MRHGILGSGFSSNEGSKQAQSRAERGQVVLDANTDCRAMVDEVEEEYLNLFLGITIFDDILKSRRPMETVIRKHVEVLGGHGRPAPTNGVVPIPLPLILPPSVWPVVRSPAVTVVFRESADVGGAIVVVLPPTITITNLHSVSS